MCAIENQISIGHVIMRRISMVVLTNYVVDLTIPQKISIMAKSRKGEPCWSSNMICYKVDGSLIVAFLTTPLSSRT